MGPGRALAFQFLAFLILAPGLAAAADESSVLRTQRTVSLYIPAVGERDDGILFGVLSVLTLTAETPGRGDVFVRTDPLAEVDMQGAARLAVAAAGEFTGQAHETWDYFFTITTSSPIIGGPSAGAAMATAASVVLMNWTLDPDVAMTGMINPDLSVGPVGGIYYKAEALAQVGVDRFLIPAGQRVQSAIEPVVGPDGTVSNAEVQHDLVQEGPGRWGMEVVEVEDLYDAVPHFTGLPAQRPTTHIDPTQQGNYLELMTRVGTDQVERAQGQHDAAEAAFSARSASMGPTDRDLSRSLLDASADGLERSRNATGIGKHYQASSFAFQSLVNSRYALAILDYYDGQGRTAAAYTADYIAEARTELEAARANAGKAFPWSGSVLGGQAALEFRVQEAARLLKDAEGSLASGAVTDAIQAASFARERIGSATWWGILRDEVGRLDDQANITEDSIRGLARDYESSAALMLAYAARLLEGSDVPRLEAAFQSFDEAEAALEARQFGAGLFGYLRTMSQVNAALASLNPPEALADRLATIRDRTAVDIDTARAAGVEPVFAVSLFEFAEYQATTSATDAYESLTLARMATRATLRVAGHPPPPLLDLPGDGIPNLTRAQEALRTAAWTVLVLGALPFLLGTLLAALVVRPAATETEDRRKGPQGFVRTGLPARSAPPRRASR